MMKIFTITSARVYCAAWLMVVVIADRCAVMVKACSGTEEFFQDPPPVPAVTTVEYTGEDCAGELSNVASELTISFNGAASSALSQQERAIWNRACLEAYNNMTFFDKAKFLKV